MIRLHQTFGAHTGRVVELDLDVIRLGRLPDNEVAFDPHADLDASGRHAEIRKEGGQWVVVDVGSKNGTLIGGQRITRHVLASGDEVEFGLGGPRVRVELVGRGSPHTAAATPLGAGAPSSYVTGPATPIGPPIAPPSHVPLSPLPHGEAIVHPTPPPSPFGPGSSPPLTPPPYGSAPPLTPPPYGVGVPPGVTPPIGRLGSSPPHPTPMMGQPTPPPGVGEKRYGQRTVGMMIQAALEQAERTRASSPNRSTAAIHAVATEAAKRSSRGLKVALAAITLLLLATAGAVVALFLYTQQQERELRDENVRLQRQLADLEEQGEGEGEERARLSQRIQELNDQIGRQEQATGSSIAERHQGAVWALVRTAGTRRSVVCSAFAVRGDLLATSAQCVGTVERAMAQGDTVRAVRNRGLGEPLVIQQMWRHPGYVASAPASPDVGMIRIRGTAPDHCQIATMTDLTAMRAGDELFVLGFPSLLAAEGAPVAGVTTGVVGRLTAFDGTEAPPVARHLVAHSAFSDDGTAGSPIFARNGHVVAINAGNVRTRRRVTDANTRLSRTVEADAPYAWAVRADLLLQLLAGLPN
ncbi:MAG: FHA domain-containing protein [Sandaracinaceae bacterium]|nr:FHA domain-containing protein [Sandaracinaceae bacterium]